jgi:hypothetical protein
MSRTICACANFYVHFFVLIIQLTPIRGFSVTDYIKYYAYLYYLHGSYTAKNAEPAAQQD